MWKMLILKKYCGDVTIWTYPSSPYVTISRHLWVSPPLPRWRPFWTAPYVLSIVFCYLISTCSLQIFESFIAVFLAFMPSDLLLSVTRVVLKQEILLTKNSPYVFLHSIFLFLYTLQIRGGGVVHPRKIPIKKLS